MTPILIDKEKLTVTITKKFFSPADIHLFKCFGFSWTPDGIITIPIRGTVKKALYTTINTCFPDAKRMFAKEYRSGIVKDIEDCYDTFNKGFDNAVKPLISFYDRLYEHQKEGVRFQCYRKYTILSFEQGLGKTVTSLVPSIIANKGVTIIIVPASLKYNWVEEMTQQWKMDRDEITVVSSKQIKAAINEKYIIINYEMVERYFEWLCSKDCKRIIIDECHRIKNRESKRMRVIKALIYKLNCSVSFLSGTPAPNKVNDMYSYLEISRHPHGQNYKTFLRNFCYTQMTQYGVKVTNAKDIDILSRDMQNIVIRKLKSECLDLPPKNYIKINFTSSEYDLEYKEMYNQLIQRLIAAKKNVDIQSQLNTLQVITSKAKVKPCIELAETIMDDSRVGKDGNPHPKKVAIMCNFIEPLKMLQNHFKEKCVFIHGGVDPEKRMDLVNAFKKMDDVQVFLGQTTAAGVGLNLTECSDVIFLNFPYTRAEVEQGADRFHRIGQDSEVTVYFTVLVGKIDEMIYKIIVKKYRDISKLIDNVVDNTDAVNVGEEYIDMFSELKTELNIEQPIEAI